MNSIKLGYIYACIAGDHRYASTVEVEYSWAATDDGYFITRRENGAVGGMDGPGGAYDAGVHHAERLPKDATPAQLVAAIKRAFDTVITRYGKPTKNFRWSNGENGLSAAQAKLIMAAARERESV